MNGSLEGLTLHVADVERSPEFYSRVPGAMLLYHRPGEFALLRIGQGRLSLSRYGGAPFHVELVTADLDGLHEQLQRAAAVIESSRQKGGRRVRDAITVWTVLVVAALLESGGDAGVRLGLRGHAWGFIVGPLALVAYGFVVNQSRWDFNRLMGVYIAVFFLVSQLLAVIVFHERLPVPVLVGGALIVVGGALIVVGGLLLTFWHAPTR